MNTPLFLTDKDVAGIIKCSPSCIREWRRRGMPARTFAGLVRFELEKVLDWLENSEQARFRRKGWRKDNT